MLKIWLISDTHGKETELNIPENVDMVIHAGDMGKYRDPYLNENPLKESINWYSKLPIKYKILIAGNHCTSIERRLIEKEEIIDTGIIYLEHESIEIEGFKIFGSPYTPTFGQGWAFNVARHKLDAYWKEIPDGTDIVITHGPPMGILDHTECGASKEERNVVSCGDKSLLNHIKRVNPLLHVFGHLHSESKCPNAGIMQIQGLKTKFINASVLNLQYNIENNGFIIEI